MTPSDLRSFEKDHAPDGWPAIQMRDISALLDEVDRLKREIQNQYRCIESHAVVTRRAEAERDALHDHYKRILWDVCKNYGTAGECVFAGFKAALEKEAK